MTAIKTQQSVDSAAGPQLCQLLAARAIDCARSDAVSWIEGRETRTIDWRTYRQRVLAAAVGLLDIGLRAGEVVAVWSSNRVENLIAELAASHCAAISASLSNAMPLRQVSAILHDCLPRIIVVEGTRGLHHAARFVREFSPSTQVVFLPAPGEETVPAEAFYSYCCDWDQIECAEPVRDPTTLAELRSRLRSAADPATIATYVYDLDIQDRVERVVLRHGDLDATVDAIEQSGLLDHARRTVSHLPLGDVNERLWSINLPLRVGGHVMCCPQEPGLEEPVLVQALRAHRPTLLMATPHIWDRLRTHIELRVSQLSGEAAAELQRARQTLQEEFHLRQSGSHVPAPLQAAAVLARAQAVLELRRECGLDTVRHAMSMIAPLPLALEQFFASIGLTLHQSYGSAATRGPAIGEWMGASRAGSIGRPFPGVRVRLAEDGELLVCPRRGAYEDDPAGRSTRERASPFDDAVVRTGDLARIDEMGWIHLLGRKHEMLILSSGEQVAPAAVEALISAQSFIADAVAFGHARPFVVAMLTVDHDRLRLFAKAHGLLAPDVDIDRLLEHPVVQAQAQLLVDDANAFLREAARIRCFRLTSDRLRTVCGDLMPVYGVPRALIHQTFSALFESMYDAAQFVP